GLDLPRVEDAAPAHPEDVPEPPGLILPFDPLGDPHAVRPDRGGDGGGVPEARPPCRLRHADQPPLPAGPGPRAGVDDSVSHGFPPRCGPATLPVAVLSARTPPRVFSPKRSLSLPVEGRFAGKTRRAGSDRAAEGAGAKARDVTGRRGVVKGS